MDGHIDCLVNTIEIDNRYFVVVYVFPSSSILPFKKDGQYNKKNWKTGKAEPVCAFKKGDVYCRRHSRSIKADNLFYTLKGNNFKIVENFLDGAPIYNEFIGRSDYLGELYKKIRAENNRVIQIDGIGGIGKTSFVHFFAGNY